MDNLTIDYIKETGVEPSNIDTTLEKSKEKTQEKLLKYKDIFFQKCNNISSFNSESSQEGYLELFDQCKDFKKKFPEPARPIPENSNELRPNLRKFLEREIEDLNFKLKRIRALIEETMSFLSGKRAPDNEIYSMIKSLEDRSLRVEDLTERVGYLEKAAEGLKTGKIGLNLEYFSSPEKLFLAI